MNSLIVTILAAVTLILLLAGCSALKPQEDPTRYFFLRALSQEQLASPDIAVGIGPVTVPGYLDHKEIVTAGPTNDLILAEFHVWAEPFDKAVTRVVARNVSRLLNSPAVVPFPDADVKRDYNTSIILRRFEMGPNGVVRLDVSYAIEGASGSGRSGASRSRSITVPVTQPDNYEAVADAMSKALADLSGSIARDLLTLARKDG